MSWAGQGEVTVGLATKPHGSKNTATDLQQMWSIYSFPDQMETIKSKQDNLLCTSSLHCQHINSEKKEKKRKKVPCFLQAKTLPLSFY